MKFENIYFINGTAYAGKSTMLKMLAEKYNGILCEENYHDTKLSNLNSAEFPALTYTRDLKDWRDFIRRTPDEYEAWVKEVTKECAILELGILEELAKQDKPVFADTNIPIEMLWEISDKDYVLIMLADPEISVNRFFERPDREKQFLYKLLLNEENPTKAMDNFRECLKRVNSREIYNNFLNSGFNVLLRDDSRTVEETFLLVEKAFGLNKLFNMKNVIHIYGASGSGTTTLGKKICDELGYTHMDTDNYFWMPTEPKYTHKRSKSERVELMKNDINKFENVVISGSLTDWGDELIPYFTLAIRIEMKQSVRIERLVQREKERYGSRIEPDGDLHQHHIEFIEWAKSYDNGGLDIRSKVMHDELEKSFPCEILYLDGEDELDEKFDKVLKALGIKK